MFELRYEDLRNWIWEIGSWDLREWADGAAVGLLEGVHCGGGGGRSRSGEGRFKVN